MFESRTTQVDQVREKPASIMESTPTSGPATESPVVSEGEDRFTPAAIQMFLGKLAD